MPNIREYTAQVDGVQPSNLGTEALAQAGRRIGAFFNQAAGVQESVGNKLGGALRDAGDVGVKYLEHSEVQRGAAGAAALFAQATAEWEQTAKTSDPNDPQARQRFLEGTLEPALQKFQEAFQTEGGQQWASTHMAQFRQHFFQKTAADQSTLAGQAAIVNTQKTINALSVAARADPASLPMIQKMLETSVEGIAGSSPTITAEEAGKIKTQLLQHGMTEIVKSGVMAAIERNPEEGMKLASDARYAPYITGSEAEHFYRQTLAAKKTDALLARQLEHERLTKASEQAKDDILRNLYDPDPNKTKITAQQILAIPHDQITPETREHLLRLQAARAEKAEVPVAVAKGNMIDLLMQIRSGAITDMDPITKALSERQIDYERYKQLQTELLDRKTPEGTFLAEAKGKFMNVYRDVVNPKDINGMHFNPTRVYDLEHYIDMQVTALKAQGKSAPDITRILFDPSSPEFVGKSAYARPTSAAELAAQARAYQTAAVEGMTGKVPTLAPNQQEKPRPEGGPADLQLYSDGKWRVYRNGKLYVWEGKK